MSISRPVKPSWTIPTASFASLNLAQAVMVVCYELFLASAVSSSENLPRLANRFELEECTAISVMFS